MRKKIKKYRNEFSSCVFFLFEYMFVLFWYNMLISQSWTLRHVSRPKTNKWIPVKTEHCSHCPLYTITCKNWTLHPLQAIHNYLSKLNTAAIASYTQLPVKTAHCTHCQLYTITKLYIHHITCTSIGNKAKIQSNLRQTAIQLCPWS